MLRKLRALRRNGAEITRTARRFSPALVLALEDRYWDAITADALAVLKNPEGQTPDALAEARAIAEERAKDKARGKLISQLRQKGILPEPVPVPETARPEGRLVPLKNGELYFLLGRPKKDFRPNCYPLGNLQTLYRRTRQFTSDTPTHFLEPIVTAWQQRPTPIDADRGTKPIMPAPFTDRYDRDELADAPALDVVDAPGLLPADLFNPNPDAPPALVKTLASFAEGRAGRAPLAAVYWLEGLLAIPTRYRDGRDHRITFTRREIYRDWAGCDPENFRSRQATRQDHVLAAMHNTKVAVKDGWYRPLVVRAIEGNGIDDRVLLLVCLPPEAKQGPAIPRAILRGLVASKLAWLGFVHICLHLDRYGGHKGRLIAATRPERERDEQGQLVDYKGEVLRGRDGRLVTRWSDARTVATGQREANPAALKQYPALGKDELIALFYPLNLPKDKQDKADKWSKTQDALKRIEAAGGIAIEKKGQGWRIMPGTWASQSHKPAEE